MAKAWEDMSVEEKLDALRDDLLKISGNVDEIGRRADAAHLGFDPIRSKLQALEARVSKLAGA